MVTNQGNDIEQRASRWRFARWTTAVLLLLLPLVAMQFTDQVDWNAADFSVFGAMLFAAAVAYELATKISGDHAYRAAAGVAIATAFCLVWVNLAVGIIGNESNRVNQMFYGVLAVAIVGTAMARFRPRGMARAMIATAAAQMLIAVIALSAGLGDANAYGVMTLFVALWLASAWLFHRAVWR